MIEANANLYIVANWNNGLCGIDLLPSICKYAVYRGQTRSPLCVIHEAAEEKAHGTSVQDLSSSKGKKLKCH
jgi:hypothetical protein